MPEAVPPPILPTGAPSSTGSAPLNGSAAGGPPWASLLAYFYGRAGKPLPQLTQIDGQDMPQPFKSLLVHSSDMTPTLETFYRQPMGLKVLSRELREDSYLREVVLHTKDREQPVEYGAIRIWLHQLPPGSRARVLEEQRPLGSILYSDGVPHLSWPQAFFFAKTDPHMRAVLGTKGCPVLYGRRNVLLDASRRLLAEVIEVLAPVE
jgi:hypothetical protein